MKYVIRIKYLPSPSYSALTYDPNSAPGSSSTKKENIKRKQPLSRDFFIPLCHSITIIDWEELKNDALLLIIQNNHIIDKTHETLSVLFSFSILL